MEQILGAGAFGTVHKATWINTDVAVKAITLKRMSEDEQKQIMTEILIHSQLRHPNIVQLMAVAREPSSIYIVMEFVSGTNLDDWIFKDDKSIRQKLDLHEPGTKLEILTQLVQVVAFMHGQNPPIVHGDIKPANILLPWKGYQLKLCDMGLSKARSVQSLLISARVGRSVGTPVYMAPEVLCFGKGISTSTDMWSLGITLVEFFTLGEAWPRDYKRLIEARQMPPGLSNSNISSEERDFISRFIKYESCERATAAQVLTKIAQLKP